VTTDRRSATARHLLDRRRTPIAIEQVVGGPFDPGPRGRPNLAGADRFRRKGRDGGTPFLPACADCERKERSEDDAARDEHVSPHCFFFLDLS